MSHIVLAIGALAATAGHAPEASITIPDVSIPTTHRVDFRQLHAITLLPESSTDAAIAQHTGISFLTSTPALEIATDSLATSATTVPTPGSLALLALAGLATIKRRRKR